MQGKICLLISISYLCNYRPDSSVMGVLQFSDLPFDSLDVAVQVPKSRAADGPGFGPRGLSKGGHRGHQEPVEAFAEFGESHSLSFVGL